MATKMIWYHGVMAAIAMSVLGCGPVAEVVEEEEVETEVGVIACDPGDEASCKSDAISWRDDPTKLAANMEFSAEKLAAYATAGQTYKSATLPWSSTYWPMKASEDIGNKDGIAARWQSPTEPSPAEKYGKLFLTTDETTSMISWIKKNHGSEVPGVAAWYGICPGWTSAAILEKPLSKNIRVKTVKDSAGKIQISTCRASEIGKAGNNCTNVSTGDLTGMMSEMYNVSGSAFTGSRCDTAQDKFEFDAYGRVKATNCRQNAASLFLTTVNFIGVNKKMFAINAVNNAEVWNQPAYQYQMFKYDTKTAAEAASLVSGKPETTYTWNTAAKTFKYVKMALTWAVETNPPMGKMPLPASNSGTYEFILEIDAAGKIIGGEWIGESKKDHPPFYWVPKAPHADAEGTRKPLWMKYQYVKALWDLAAKG